MPFYRDPNGKLYDIPSKNDATTGEDLNRNKMVAKGYTPVLPYTSPDFRKKVFVDQTPENIDKMKAKGWKLPFEEEFGQEGGKFLSGTITRDEIQRLATKHNVPFEKLDSLVEYLGGNPDYREPDRARAFAGTVSRGLGSNILQFVYRKLQDPQERKAISDLQELARARQSTTATVAETAASFLTPSGVIGKAATTGGKLLQAATVPAIGATVGAAQAREGEEVPYAILGTVLSVAPAAVGKAVQKVLPKTAEEQAAVLREIQAANRGKDIETRIAQERAANADILQARERAIVNQQVTETDLETMGDWVLRTSNKPTKNILEKQREVAQKMLPSMTDAQWKQALGSADLDRQNVLLAKHLGWEGPSVNIKKAAKAPVSFEKTVSQAKQFISEYRKQPGGNEQIAKAYNGMIDAKIAASQAKKVFALDPQERFVPLRQFFESVADGKYVARGIDRRLGTNLEGTILEMDNATNVLTYVLADAQASLKTLSQQAKKVGLDVTKFREALETGQTPTGTLTDEQAAVVKDVADFFEKHRQVISDDFKFTIPKRDNYFPHIMPSTLESISRIKNRAKAITEKTGIDILNRGSKEGKLTAYTPAEYKKILAADPDFVKAIQLVSRDVVVDGNSLARAFHGATVPGAAKKPKQVTEASAAFVREDAIPSFLLQDDLQVAGMNWVQETYRHVLIKDQLAQMSRIRDIAASLGDIRAKEYLDGLLDDLTGLRVGSLASETTKMRIAVRTKIDEKLDAIPEDGDFLQRVQRSALQTMRDVPEAWSTMVSMAYPNFLGLSPRAVLMNLSQIPTMTLPELGVELSARYTPRVLARMAKTLLQGETLVIKNPYLAKQLNKNIGDTITTQSYWKILHNEGFLSKQYTQEMVDALRNDMELALPVKAFKSISNSYSNFAMFAFSKTEEVNRIMAVNFARELADDLIKGQDAAMNWLKNMQGAMKFQIASKIEAGDSAEVTRLVSEYLLSKTILNYTRQSMSNFGRFMGPVFSMFTKWPSTIYGDIIEQYSARSVFDASLDIAKRYLAPWGFLALANFVIYEAAGKSNEGRVDAILGKRGMAAWAPITSVEALVGGEFLKSPSSDIATAIMTAIMNPQDPEKLARAANDAAMTFLPGMALGRVLLQDLPRLAGDDKAKFTLIPTGKEK